MVLPVEVGYKPHVFLAQFKVVRPDRLEIHVPVEGTINLTRNGWDQVVQRINEAFEEVHNA